MNFIIIVIIIKSTKGSEISSIWQYQ